MKINQTTKDKIKAAIPQLKEKYAEAGYERALDLEKKVNETLASKGSFSTVFDDPELSSVAIDCFHSGTWQIWMGDGQSELESLYSNSMDEVSIEDFLQEYMDLDKCISAFIAKVEEWLSKRNLLH